MAKAPNLNNVGNIPTAAETLNTNFARIAAAFENTVSRDGSTPNTMSADLDMNSNDLLNVGTINATEITVRGASITASLEAAEDAADAAQAFADAADDSAVAAALSESNAAASEAAVLAVEESLPEWKGAWQTATAYGLGDLVRESGSTYICVIAHTSGTFSTDLSNLRWDLFAQVGAAGPGGGNMLAANNLSDVANVATARSNLGLGTMATQAAGAVAITGGSISGITDLAVADGGTGASNAAGARTNLGLGSLAVQNEIDTTDISAATLVTASEGISSNNNDTTIPTSAAVKAYADSIGADIFFRLNSAHAGADSTSAQNLFPQAVTLEANTVYEYEIFWSISKTAGATSHTLSTGFGGTATLNNIQRNFAFNGSTTLTYASSFTSAGYLLTANSTLFANAVANATVNYWNSERGTVSINGAGTFIPQYTLSAAPGGAYSTNIGSYFRLRRLGASGSNLSSGSWA